MQKLRVLTSFYRDRVQFFASGTMAEEQFGFGVKERGEFNDDGINPLQRDLAAVMEDKGLPLKKRLMAVVTRLRTALEELSDDAEEAERESGLKLEEFISFDLCEMQCVLGDFIPEAND